MSGIHGYPLKPWDGVQAVGAGTSGYCTHGSNLFGPWHRPYLALHEQQVHTWGVKIAQQFNGSNSEAYHQASLTLRMPYWDWAANPSNNGPILPNVLSSPNAFVTYPNGSTATVPNPLYSYHFHPLNPSDFRVSKVQLIQWYFIDSGRILLHSTYGKTRFVGQHQTMPTP